MDSIEEIKTDFDGFQYISSDLTLDGLLTVKANIRKMEFLDRKQKEGIKTTPDEKRINELKTRVKCICLNKMGLSIMKNTLDLNKSEREKLKLLMYAYNDKLENDIITEFNAICNSEIFNDKIEYEKFPIYNK